MPSTTASETAKVTSGSFSAARRSRIADASRVTSVSTAGVLAAQRLTARVAVLAGALLVDAFPVELGPTVHQ
jgi:hypothetical protein